VDSAGQHGDRAPGRQNHACHADQHAQEDFCGVALFSGNKDVDGIFLRIKPGKLSTQPYGAMRFAYWRPTAADPKRRFIC